MNPTFTEKALAMLKKYLTPIAVLLMCGYFGYAMRPPADAPKGFHFREFGSLPVIDGGRYKPMQTVAATNLMIITHRTGYYDAKAKKSYPAVKWLLDVQTTPLGSDGTMVRLFPNGAAAMPAFQHEVFRIENDQVLEFLHLKRNERLRYSIAQIMQGDDVHDNPRGNAGAFFAEAERVRIKAINEPKKLTLFEGKIHELAQHIQLYISLANHSVPLVIPNNDGSDQWKSFGDAYNTYSDQEEGLPDDIEAKTFLVYKKLYQAYDKGPGGIDEFNQTLAKHLADLRDQDAVNMRKIGVEVFFNDFAPFFWCWIAYLAIAVVAIAAFAIPEWTRPIQKACYAAMLVSFAVHLSGLIIRMYLQDRLFVFVTNLYSSAVFIGLGCVVFCLISEAFFKNGIAIVVGCVGGFLTLIIAHMLSQSGDTLEMMQAVLDTNFWLATHVTIITLGYVSALVAGLMGCAYIFLGIFTNSLRKDGSANLTRATYGVLCAGMFLSFVGTVLGGLWADYSWGRFWGWDPKENGALLIVIWIALILHARWGGMVKHRGIAVLSVLGIVVTSWSWFGTNFLGVGLHSYGFRQGAMTTLILFDVMILAIAGLGMIPLPMWQSFRAPSQAEPAGMPRPRAASL
jgi:ABC-type transport system involved in cytochrome c biogenesis permease subunit